MRYLIQYDNYRVLQNSLQKDIDKFLKSIDRTIVPEGYKNEFTAYIANTIHSLQNNNKKCCRPIDISATENGNDFIIHINGNLFRVFFLWISELSANQVLGIGAGN